MANDKLEKELPSLKTARYTVTSKRTVLYNCIAWAAGESHRCWWPDDSYYWPDKADRSVTIDAFVQAYATIGYIRCADGSVEDGLEKVAIYAAGGHPKHAAKQLADGTWSSKCGTLEDISHTLDGLKCPNYGEPVVFLSRPVPAVTAIDVA